MSPPTREKSLMAQDESPKMRTSAPMTIEIASQIMTSRLRAMEGDVVPVSLEMMAKLLMTDSIAFPGIERVKKVSLKRF